MMCNESEILTDVLQNELEKAAPSEVQHYQTFWNKTTFSTDISPWSLRKEPDRGLVAYSNYAFKRGDMICTEFPTVWIHGHHPFNQAQMDEIGDKVSSLREEEKEAFFAMENVFPNAFPSAVGIFMTNCFDMTGSIFGTTCAMYLALARLNHSCCPNAQQTHIPSTTEEVLFAARDIAIGEEINDCYIELRQDRQQRRKELLEYYCFHCECPACSCPDSALLSKHDSLRREAFDFNDKLVMMVGEDIDVALAYASNIVHQLEDSETTVWSVRFLPEIYYSFFQLHSSLSSSSKAASKYLLKAYNLTLQLEGDRSPEAVKFKGVLNEFIEQQLKRSTKRKKKK